MEDKNNLSFRSYNSSKKNLTCQGQSTRSNSSIDSSQSEFTTKAILWMLKLRKKIEVGKDTIYCAIALLNRWIGLGKQLSQQNYQCVAACMIIISSKLNEIYPPSMDALLFRTIKDLTRDDLINQQAIILQAFQFDVAFTETAYHSLLKILHQDQQKLEQSEKILSKIISFNELSKFGEKMIALAIIYLIKPIHLKDYTITALQRIKYLAGKVYTTYISTKGIDSK